MVRYQLRGVGPHIITMAPRISAAILINGLDKPYYGLSQSTLDGIKQHKIKMLVDWVKVTQYR